MRIGAHIGVAHGYERAVEYAVSVGCECIQVFAKNPRQWRAKSIDSSAAQAFRARCTDLGIGPVMVHTAYLINLGSADDTLWERSYVALADELVRAEILGAAFVVTHVGTRYKQDPEHTAERIAAGIERAWALADAHGVRLLLENTAGAGSSYGNHPEELGAIVNLLVEAAPHIGICLDTCHAHAAGWDLSGPEGWKKLIDAFKCACSAPVEAVHANDCRFGAGMHKDRHAWIGDGTIGYGGFAAMCSEWRATKMPVVLEMPGEVPLKDAENIRRLKQLRDACEEFASCAEGPTSPVRPYQPHSQGMGCM